MEPNKFAQFFNALNAFLDGKKTYFVTAIGIVYVFGGEQGWWNTSETLLMILGFGGIAALRKGVSKVVPMILMGMLPFAAMAGTNGVLLEWEYPPQVIQVPNAYGTNQFVTNLPTVFYLRSVDRFETDMHKWELLAVIPAMKTNVATEEVSIRTTWAVSNLSSGTRFFTLTASNSWGETPFSNTETRPAPLLPPILTARGL